MDLISSKPERRCSIAIVGGGLGGLFLAIGLLKQIVPFHIYEAAAAFAEIGAGVSFSPNTVETLRLMGPDVFACYEKCVTHNESKEHKRTSLSFRYGTDSRNGNGKKFPDVVEHLLSTKVGGVVADGSTRIHRAKLLEELIKLVPGERVSFRKSLESIEETSDGVILLFKDGSTAPASAVIGCDGIKSRTRKIVLGEGDPAAKPVFAGEYAYRGLVPRDLADSALGSRTVGDAQLYLGYGGYLMTYPVDHGRFMNMIAVKRVEGTAWNKKEWVSSSTREEMLKDFQGFHETLIALLDQVAEPNIWGLHDHLPAKTYYRGRICLLGDSAHASTPAQGAGVGMAIEDAYILSNLLGMLGKQDNPESIFRAYDEVRRPRTQQLVTTSRDAGRLWSMELAGVEDDLERIRMNIKKRYHWIWHLDLVKHLEEAQGLVTSSSGMGVDIVMK